jgi:hypothetical protein
VTRAGEFRGGDRGWSATRARRSHAARGEKGGGDSGRIRVSARVSGEIGLRQKGFRKIFSVPDFSGKIFRDVTAHEHQGELVM